MRSRFASGHRHGFSLVEMLTVLAVMSVLTLLTMSSISALKSASLSTSGNQMVDVFAMARQNSISKNVSTAVVIRTTGTGACAAYTLLQLARNDDGTYGSWTELTPWRYLPKGVVFENDQTPFSADTFMKNLPALPVPLPTSYPFQGSEIDLSAAAGNVVQCYQADGTLLGGLPLKLRLIQGTADSAGTVTYTGATASGAQISYYDLYFIANTGTTKIGRL